MKCNTSIEYQQHSNARALDEAQSLGKSTRLIPVPKWNDYHPWPTSAGLRYLIFHASKNGFDSAITRVNRRVLIDEQAFFEWVNTHKESC